MRAKPVEAIERMRELYKMGWSWDDCHKEILAWADSIPADAVPVVWPAHLTREFLLRLIDDLATSVDGPTMNLVRAIQDLAAIAPVRKKRVVDLWRDGLHRLHEMPVGWKPNIQTDWRPVSRNVELED